MRAKTIAWALCASLAISCARPQSVQRVLRPLPPPVIVAPRPQAPPTTPDAPFRAEAPPPGPTPEWTAPRIERFQLANGMTVLLVERHDLPLVSIEYVTRRGASDGPPSVVQRPGLASFTGSLLELGTRRRDSLRLSDDLESIGAEHTAWMSWDSGGVSLKVLASNFQPGLELLADMVQNPAFDREEIERLRLRRLAAIRQELDSPRTIASNVAARVVFGDAHPYGRSLIGTMESVRAITPAEIAAFYRSHYGASDGALIVVGDVTRAAIEPQLNTLFGRWRPRTPAPVPAPVPAQVRGVPRIFLVDRGPVPQSNIVIAHVGVPRSTPDYAAIVVMNTILGGMFSSRINLNLREAHAYSYGAGSGFAMRHLPGPFAVSAAVTTRHTADAIREVFNELNRMRTTDVTEEELRAAQSRLTESLPARFEGVDQVANAIADIFVYNLPLDEYATYAARIRAVTVADVRRVAQQYLDPDNARVVVVGSRADVEQSLRELNMGPVEIRTPLGDPEAAAASASGPATVRP